MGTVVWSFIGFYLLASLVEWKAKSGIAARVLLALNLFGWIGALLCLGPELSAAERLFSSCVGTLWILKIIVRGWPRNRVKQARSFGTEILYRFFWPGMTLTPFQQKKEPQEEDGYLFVQGYLSALGGVSLFFLLAFFAELLGDSTLGFLGLIPFFLVLHFGYALLLPAALRLLSLPAPLLFDSPLRSLSLHEFWSVRWNRPFVEMNRVIFYEPAARFVGRRTALVLTFLASGLLHELGISYPAGGGWGLPTIYFLLHAALVSFEGPRGTRANAWPKTFRFVWVMSCLLIPLPLLFPAPFRSALIIPLFRNTGELLRMFTVDDYLRTLLLFAGFGHFLVLCAGAQVPSRLDWKNDLKKLSPFNEKIMWNYGLFIFLIIFAFGVETLLFRDEMLFGVPSALGMATLIGLFWLLRILVDCFYFQHSDWPQGPQFIIGHAMLNSLFVFLALTFLGLVLRHSLI